jgi:hypothetical protein
VPPHSSSTDFPKRCISVTSSANLLILHPDILLTATALSNAPQCRRKPLLTSLVRSTSDITPALVWGSMLHEVIQRCLLEKRWDEAWIDKCLQEAVSGGLGELVKLGLSEEIALREMRERAKGFKFFAERYLGDVPKVICLSLTLKCLLVFLTGKKIRLMRSSPIRVLELFMNLLYWQSLDSWISKKIFGHPHTVLKEN